MVLWHDATDRPVTASPTLNSDYAANLSSKGAQWIYALLKAEEPKLTEMALVNIIRSPKTRAAIKGKTFLDLCPTYGCASIRKPDCQSRDPTRGWSTSTS